MKIMILLMLTVLMGCASSQPLAHLKASAYTSDGIATENLSDVWCLELMESRDNWMFTAKLMAGVSGAGGLSTAAPEDNDVRWGIGAASASVAAFGVAALWLSDKKGEEFEEYCEVSYLMDTDTDTDTDSESYTESEDGAVHETGPGPRAEPNTGDAPLVGTDTDTDLEGDAGPPVERESSAENEGPPSN